MFNTYKTLCCRAFLCLRRNSELIYNLFSLVSTKRVPLNNVVQSLQLTFCRGDPPPVISGIPISYIHNALNCQSVVACEYQQLDGLNFKSNVNLSK